MSENASDTNKKPGKPAKAVEKKNKKLTKKQLKTYLESIRDKMSDGASAPIYSLGTMSQVLNMPNIYEALDKDNKEIARDIWLRIKASGVNVQLPPLLFDQEEIQHNSGAE